MRTRADIGWTVQELLREERRKVMAKPYIKAQEKHTKPPRRAPASKQPKRKQ
jgi:hypothetical protein